MAISVGSAAPKVVLKSLTKDGLVDVDLSQHQGKENVVVLFFPAAFTGVCTTEMCDVSNGLSAYQGVNAVVYGVSPDTPFAQAAWAEKNGIQFPLLSDYAREATQGFDVVLPDLAGLGPGAKRAAFVIDREGVVRYSEETPTPLELPNFDAIHETLKGL